MPTTDHRRGQSYVLSDLRTTRQIAHRFRMAGDARVADNGLLGSESFDPEVQDEGWGVFGDGHAVFQDVELHGDIIADSFATGVTPDERIEVTTTDSSSFFFYTGDVDETAPGQFGVDVLEDPDFAARYPAFGIVLPAFDTRPRPEMGAYGESMDGSGGLAQCRLRASSTNMLAVYAVGSAAHPTGTGFRLETEGNIEMDGDDGFDLDVAEDITLTAGDDINMNAGGDIRLTPGSGVVVLTGNLQVSASIVADEYILKSTPSNILYYLRCDDAGVLSTVAV